MKSARHLLYPAALAIAACLSACGQKGPLYLPKAPAPGIPAQTTTPPSDATAPVSK